MDESRCRLCLEGTIKYIDIFQAEDHFSQMIEELTGLKILPNDGMPTMSCLQCHQHVKTAMLTRNQIINSYKRLMEELNLKKMNRNSNDLKCGYISLNEDIISTKQEMLPVEENILQNFSSNTANSVELRLCDENEDDSSLLDMDTIKAESQLIAKIVSRRKSAKKVQAKQIKFRRKLSTNHTDEKVKFKKKECVALKVQFDIKPEHQDFLKTVGRKDRVACPDCGRVMFGMNMKNHLITHQYDPVNCEICGKTSKNAQALQDHINYYHKTTPDRFICDKCGKGYRVRCMLVKHVKKEHGDGEKDYECSICGKKFYENLHLKNHINITHKKIKAYKCEHCGKDFGRRTQFVTHQLVHTKENRYHCQICGKGFKIKQTMQTHLKGVHGIEEEKTIFCKICRKGFSTTQGLRAHVNSRVHGLEKCEHCAEFITLEYKQVHLKDVHGIVLESAYG